MRYIGSKSHLLTEINQVVTKHTSASDRTFLDLFAGTNAVGRYFKNRFNIYSNDLLYFSFVNAKATIEINEPLTFARLKNLQIYNPLDYLQKGANKYSEGSEIGYYEENYSPTGNAMYLTVENAKRIDYIRDTIDAWNTRDLLEPAEYYYLVSSLIESIPSVSNITGTYGAFLKHWDNRSFRPLILDSLEIINNHKINRSFNEDANDLIKHINADIAYIDTPYNERQYAPNYHLLENIAKNTKPQLTGKTHIFNWKNLKSQYSTRAFASESMTDLIKNINCNHLILSYNNEGIIPISYLKEILQERSINGNVEVTKIPYRKYKSKIPSKSNELFEVLLYAQIQPTKQQKPAKPISIPITRWKEPKTNYLKSPLNYIGGKYRLLPQIIPLIPNDINTFVDLFSGGANVGINVQAQKYIFNDMNTRINEIFRYFMNQDADSLIKTIHSKISAYNLSKTNETAYTKFRSMYNKNPNPLDLYILASFSYNYQFRFNNSMEFNNPFGRNRSHFSERMANNLREFVTRIQLIDASFTDHYFEDFNYADLTEKDFVYMDPPYLITTGSYNDGNRGFRNWTEDQENTLLKIMLDLDNRNIRFALSNVLTHKGKVNHILYDFIQKNNLYIHYLEYNYKNSSYNTKDGKTKSTEVLITNYSI